MESSVHSNAIWNVWPPGPPQQGRRELEGLQGVGGSRFHPLRFQGSELGHVAPRLCGQVQGAEDDAGLDFHIAFPPQTPFLLAWM